MKRKRNILIFVLVAIGVNLVTSRNLNADFTFGTPINVGAPLNTSANDGTYSFSPDGLELYLASDRDRDYEDYDLMVATRATENDEWGTPVNLGQTINSPYYDSMPCLSPDGLELFFNSARPGGIGVVDLWVTTRMTKNDAWQSPVNLGSIINSSNWEQHPTISSDGLTLIFESGRLGHGDLWVTTRTSKQDAWSIPANLGSVVNTTHDEWWPRLAPNGLVLFFTSNRPGGYGNIDLWMTIRPTIKDEWCVPVNLGPTINTSAKEGAPTVSLDGSILYFASDRSGGLGAWDQWQVSVDPVVDLNDDGIVDASDMCIIVDNWGTDEPLCDIGPTPFGDGIVDVQDLIVLAEHLFEETTPVE